MIDLLVAVAIAIPSGIGGFILSCCISSSKTGALHDRVDQLTVMVSDRDEIINQMALAIRNVALLLTDDGRATQEIVSIISRTEAMIDEAMMDKVQD